MSKNDAASGYMSSTSRMLDSIHISRRSSKVIYVILVLIYIGFTLYIPQVSKSSEILTVFGRPLPVSSFAGVLSSLVSISLILMVVFYRKLGYYTALILSLLQFPLQIRNMLNAPVLSGLPGVFSNILVIVATTVIYINYRRTDEFQQKLRDQAVVDSLTGLPNRFASGMLVDQLIDRKQKFTLVSVDLNNFKGINDMIGHQAGDRVLCALAERWKALAAGKEDGAEDFVSRVSGDEFVIILRRYASEEDVRQRIEMYRAETEKTLTVDDCDYHLHASFGYAEYPTDADTKDALVTYADAAMLKAKSLGEDKPVRKFTGDLLSFEHEMEIERKIRTALEQDLIFFHLQPQYTTVHRLRGFEALARMKDENGKMISPGEFIPVAEKTGLVHRIDNAVFRKSAAFFGELLRKTGADITLSVNVSVQHLMKKDFISEVKSILSDYKVPAEQVEIEITESIMMDSAESASRRINELKEIGLKIAIDDFGTGYSSLSYLNEIPANLLKVDKSFIDRMNASDSSRKYVAAIISIGHIMNLDVIAEGVEEDDQMRTLREIGCDYIQGFIWGRPMPPEEAEKLVA